MKKLFARLQLRDPIWQAIGVFVAVLTLLLAVFGAFDSANRSTGLTIDDKFDFDPLEFGESMKNRAALLIDGVKADSLVVGYYSIINTGQTPIAPGDYVKPIRISIDEPPWELLSVTTSSTNPPNLDVKWTKVTTNTFEMEPILLNPQDSVNALLFVTRPGIGKSDFPSKVDWSARIVNLKALALKSTRTSPDPLTGVGFSVYGSNIYVLLASSVILFMIATGIAIRSGRLVHLSARQLVLLGVFALSSYPTGVIFIDLTQGGGLIPLQWLLISFNLCVLFYLLWPFFANRVRANRT